MNSQSGFEGAQAVYAMLASGLEGYLKRAQQLGAVEGTEGALMLNPALRPVLQAMHHVLAGGEVEVYVLRRGQADIVSELDQRAEQATQEANTLSAEGYTLSATV